MHCNIKKRSYISIVTFVSLLIFASSPDTSGNELPFVIITVDVETKNYKDASLPLPEQVNAICQNDIPCGLQEMIRLLKEKEYAATFFLNVYEYKKYGEPILANIAKWFRASGQDVQLHTHPQWVYDQNRNMMYQYTLNEQTGIIRDGKKLLQKWTGQPVVAHRAGAYSADENTLKALIENGIFYDSSHFFGWSNSKINSLNLKKNVLSLYGPLYEYPITVYKRNKYPAFSNNKVKSISEIRKYDINWFIDDKEVEEALGQAINSNMDFIIVFLHSYSFIKGRNEAGEMVADGAAIDKFEKVLNLISTKRLKVVTFRQLENKKDELAQYLNKSDVIPEVSVQIGIIQYLRQLAGINQNNYKMFILFFIASFLLVAVLIKALGKRKF